MSRGIVGKQMVITINITQGTSGLFFAKSADAPNFLASHSDECALREALPLMIKCWAEENGYANVSIRVLPARESGRKNASESNKVRLGLKYRQPAMAL